MKRKKTADSITLPAGKYKATKLASTHNNVDRVCRGYLSPGWGAKEKDEVEIKVGKAFGLSGGDYEGLRTTEIKEIELYPSHIIIHTQNSTYKIEEDNSNIYGNGNE